MVRIKEFYMFPYPKTEKLVHVRDPAVSIDHVHIFVYQVLLEDQNQENMKLCNNTNAAYKHALKVEMELAFQINIILKVTCFSLLEYNTRK